MAQQLEAIGRQFGQWGGPEQGPGIARWSRLREEVQRYRQGQADSSLLALERYLAAVGSQLRADNCAQLLAAQPAPRESDEIGMRHAQVHRALSARCAQIRDARPPG
jgi:type VI secretion system protein ImpL